MSKIVALESLTEKKGAYCIPDSTEIGGIDTHIRTMPYTQSYRCNACNNMHVHVIRRVVDCHASIDPEHMSV